MEKALPGRRAGHPGHAGPDQAEAEAEALEELAALAACLDVAELRQRCLAQPEVLEEDLSPAAVLGEMAELVLELLESPGDHADALDRCLAAVEEVARTESPDAVAMWSFLDGLGPERAIKLREWMGPTTANAAGLLDQPRERS